MQLRNCPNCGKVYVQGGLDLCPDCLRDEEREFEQVREYLREHPRAPLRDVVAATGVEERKVLKFIRSGRLICIGVYPIRECEMCGKPIDDGRLCPSCAREVNRTVQAATPQPERQAKRPQPLASRRERMYTADRIAGERGERDRH